MRPPLALAAASLLLLTAGMAGCFERRGTLAVELIVSDAGDVDDFRSVNVTLKDIRIKARTMNLETFPVPSDPIELRRSAAAGQSHQVFLQEVRSDQYTKVELTTQGSAFQGTLRDGTRAALTVPDSVLIATSEFEVPRGGAVTFVFSVQVTKQPTGQGLPSYVLIWDPQGSGPR
jgi:hypothetical protein